jgi:hypothetical protein
MKQESESEKLARNINEGMRDWGESFVSVFKWLFFGGLIFIGAILILSIFI